MRIARYFLFALGIILAAPEARALEILPGVDKNIVLHMGARALDEDSWAPLGSQGLFVIEMDFKPKEWPVSFLVGLSVSADKRSETVIANAIPISADFEGSIASLDAGVRKYLELFPDFALYVDAGATVFSAEVIVGSQWTGNESSSDAAVGVFYGAGAAVRFYSFTLGVNFRMMNGQQVTLFEEKIKTDYAQFALTFGASF